MKIVWTSTAAARIEAIEDFIAADDPSAAIRFVDSLIDAVEDLADHPERGRLVPELPGSALRELVFRGYRVIYRLGARRIEVLTVFEGHRLVRPEELE